MSLSANKSLTLSSGPARMLQLDILRGIAILLVLGRHFVVNAKDAGFLLPLAGVWQRFGWTGVDLFFVLSGFLVGGLLCAEARDYGHIDVKRFIIRRGFKIWPLYYLFLITILIASFFGYGTNPASTSWIPNDRGISPTEQSSWYWPSFLHIQNYLAIPRGESYWYHTRIFIHNHIPSLSNLLDYASKHAGLPRGHLWSLAIEEHFYLLLPLVMILLLRRAKVKSGATPNPGATGLRSSQTRAREMELSNNNQYPSAPKPSRIHLLPYIALFTMLLCTTLRCLKPVPHLDDRSFYFPWYSHLFPTHLRIDGLFFGVLLAYLYHFKPAFPAAAAKYRWHLLALGLLLISPMMLLSMDKTHWIPQIGFTLLYLGYGCILVAALSMSIDWMPRATGPIKLAASSLRAIGWVGLFSYPIYLWHQDLGRYPVQYLIDSGILDRAKPFFPASATTFGNNTFLALRWLLATSLYLALAIFLSSLLGKAIERPALKLRDHLFPRRSPALDSPNAQPSKPSPEPAMAAN